MALAAPVLDSPPLRRDSPPALMVGVTPAAGVNFTQAVNDGLWWRLITVFCRVVTDANAADRQLQLQYLDQESNVWNIDTPPVTFPASQTTDYSFAAGRGQADWTAALPVIVPLTPVLLQPGHSFRLALTSIQATDAISRVRYTVEKFYPPASSDYDLP
jgi:hypothetical protein